jgi:hypothetical protein
VPINKNKINYTKLGPLAWGPERGGGEGDSSDDIQIDSYHMAATGTVSSSSSSDKRKASGDDQQRRATVGVDRNSGQQCFKIDS